jgi:outer membrane autotransporter protein
VAVSSPAGLNNAGTLSVNAGTTGTITGNYTQTSSGTFQTNVSNDTTYGKLLVTGTATLPASANINVNVASPNFVFSTAVTNGLPAVISAGTLSASSFNVTTNSVLLSFAGTKNGNQLDLTLVAPVPAPAPVPVPATTITASVNAVGNVPAIGAATELNTLFSLVLNTGTSGNAIMDNVINKLVNYGTSQQRVSDAVSQTLPLHAGGETAAITGSMRSVNNIVQSRQEGQQGRSSGDEFYGNKQIWMKPFGGVANQGDRAGVSGYNAKNYGLIFGVDGETSSTNRIGLAFVIANSKIAGNSTVAPQSSTISTYQAVMYGSHSLDKDTDISWQGDIGNSTNKGLRNITFMGTTAQSNYNSLSAHLGAGVARTMPLNETSSFTPSVHVDYTTVHNAAYTETGAGGLNLMVNSSKVDELIVSADGKFLHALQDNTQLSGNVGIGYDTMAKQASITSAFSGAPAGSFTTLGMNPSPWIARGGVGVVRKLISGTEISARYDAETRSSGFTNQTISIKACWGF